MALNWQTEYLRYQRHLLRVKTLYRRKEVRVYTELVLTILTICFFLLFAIKPTLVTITGLIKTIQDQRLVSQKLAEKITALNQAQNLYNSIQMDLPLVDEALPKDPQLNKLIKHLETLAYNSGIKIETLQISQVNLKEENIVDKQVPINFILSISGDYQNLKNFLKGISSLRRVILVSSYGFKTGKTETQTLYLSINNQTFYGINQKGK